MDKEKLMDMLRNPAKYRAEQKTQVANQKDTTAAQASKKKQDTLLLGVCGVFLLLLGISLLFMLVSKKKAENLTPALDQKQIQGLTVQGQEFSPTKGDVTYVKIHEGQDRNVAVSNLGTTLPIISRFNYKSFTPLNYETIGAAPWALTMNFSSNMKDPELLRYLLANETMIKAFLNRSEVAPLLEDPQMLEAFLADSQTLEEFFESETIKQILASEPMIDMLGKSRWVSYLLISKTGKYFRQHPDQAKRILDGNPYLKELLENAAIRKAVSENKYLKKAAPVLLQTQATPTKK